MSLNKKRPLAALYFRNRIIQGHFPLRAFIAPNMGNPFRGAHSFSSVNAFYLHGIGHPWNTRSARTRPGRWPGAGGSAAGVDDSGTPLKRVAASLPIHALKSSGCTSSANRAAPRLHQAGAPQVRGGVGKIKGRGACPRHCSPSTDRLYRRLRHRQGARHWPARFQRQPELPHARNAGRDHHRDFDYCKGLGPANDLRPG